MIDFTKTKIKIEDFHIGFEYEELELDKQRYLNRGMVWVKKTYNHNSPRLHKIAKLIEDGKIRRANNDKGACSPIKKVINN